MTKEDFLKKYAHCAEVEVLEETNGKRLFLSQTFNLCGHECST